MSLQPAHDIPVQISVAGDALTTAPTLSAERRISPSWTISQLKAKLEPVTGIPPSSQRLMTRDLSGQWITLDQDTMLVGDQRLGLQKGSEIEITDIRPPSARQNLTDVSAVDKYEMSETQYEQLNDTVLAWKKRQQLGRFDPHARSAAEMIRERATKDEADIASKGIKVGERCRVGSDDTRRGIVRFVGEVVGLGGEKEAGCCWVGVELDEPLGRNDGSVKVVVGEEVGGREETRRLFHCRERFGVLVRPQKVEMGLWPPFDDLEVDEDMKEV